MTVHNDFQDLQDLLSQKKIKPRKDLSGTKERKKQKKEALNP